MTKGEAKYKGTVLLMLSEGVAPTPKNIAERMGYTRNRLMWDYEARKYVPNPRPYNGADGHQNGTTARWRREILSAAGWMADKRTGRFFGPKDIKKRGIENFRPLGAYDELYDDFRSGRIDIEEYRRRSHELYMGRFTAVAA